MHDVFYRILYNSTYLYRIGKFYIERIFLLAFSAFFIEEILSGFIHSLLY